MNQAITPKQQRFVDEYLISLNATQAAIKAGYSVKCAKEQGHRLLTYAHIQKMVVAANDEHMENAIVTREWILLNLKSIVERGMRDEIKYYKKGNANKISMCNAPAAIRALELLGKHLGLFTTKATMSSNPQETLLDLV